ncbi:MAG: GSCFA domain-containing protein [Bacteroidales bacterium]
MQLSTPVNVPKLNAKLRYGDKGLTMGSCFANNIGSKLKEGKFDFAVNPMGIAYNPASISKQILRALEAKPYPKSDFFEHEGLWKSYDFHSDMAIDDLPKSCEYIDDIQACTHNLLSSSKTIIITLGTAWIYELAKSGEVVANCHKQPASCFKRRRLPVDEIIDRMTAALEAVFKINPSAKIILTVSPIRHLKDGAVENQLSKSSLLLAVDRLCRDAENIEYFPAYEIMMDEMRDYRYYADDMTHPSPMAVEILWQKFLASGASDETRKLYDEISKIVLATKHKARNPSSADYRRFVEAQKEKIRILEKHYPQLNLQDEKLYFERH